MNIRLFTFFCILLPAGCSGNLGGSFFYDGDASTSSVAQPGQATYDSVGFARQLWAPVFSQKCYGCHIEGGMAHQRGARFVLTAPTQPHYIDDNLAAARNMADIKENGQSLLWLKPTGRVPHGGGTVVPAGSDDEKAIMAFVAGSLSAQDSTLNWDPGVEQALTFQTEVQTLHQAALVLAGRLPNAQEINLAQNGNLALALDSIIADPNFDALVHRVYNDLFLTDALEGDNSPAIRWGACYGGPTSLWFANDLLSNINVSWGMTQNVPQLIARVIRQDRPFTEILTANYIMANPLGACTLLGPGHSIPYSLSCSADGVTPVNLCDQGKIFFDVFAIDRCREFLPVVPNGKNVCGVLSDTTVLGLLPTTASNRNRHRAAFIMTNFLDLDPLSLGSQLPPGTAVTSSDPNLPPTLTNAQCVVCHQLVDGVGSSLRNWSTEPAYMPIAQPNDIFAPALFGRAMPSDSQQEPVCWLSEQIAADPGFARATVKIWFKALTGLTPLREPLISDPNYASRLAMKLEQNAFFTQVAKQFAADNFNFRHMLENLIMSSYFRSTGVAAGTSADVALQASMYGHAQRRGPEQLSRVIISLTGRLWRENTVLDIDNHPIFTPIEIDGTNMLLNDFLDSYGGIDSHATTQRNPDMSSVMAAIAHLMAVDVPCQGAAADFLLPAASRELFPYVDLTTLPDNGAGTVKIKQNIQYLYAHLLGESVALNDAEMDAAYGLFTAVYTDYSTDASLDPRCASGAITTDSTHTLHAWMAVETSLLNDMEFLYE